MGPRRSQENVRISLGNAEQLQGSVGRPSSAVFPTLHDFGADVQDIGEHSLAGAKSLADFLDLARTHRFDPWDFGDAKFDREPLLSGDGVTKAFHEFVEDLDFLWHDLRSRSFFALFFEPILLPLLKGPMHENEANWIYIFVLGADFDGAVEVDI
jgi:hypothetical protein